MSVISVKNLNITINDHHIIDGVSFNVEKGEIAALIGPNGSGKTTIVKALLGLTPYEGEISILGVIPENLIKISSKIGYVPQKLDFDRNMPITVKELLSIHSTNRHKAKKIEEALSLASANYLLNKRIGVLSGGEFQRVLLALSLINNPEILFLDEPSAGIDIEGAGEIIELIDDLKREKGITIILVSHDIDVVLHHADKVFCINHKLICQGTPHRALSQKTLEELYGSHHGLFEHKDHKKHYV